MGSEDPGRVEGASRVRVLVTGGAGYIGSHAARELARRGHTVRILDNLSTGYSFLAKEFELRVGDIGNAADVHGALEGIGAVMHFAAHSLAGESVEKPAKYFRNNVGAALNLLDCVAAAGIPHFIFSSTCAVYGIPVGIPIREETPCWPANPYGASKLAFEHALSSYGSAYGFRFLSLRYFNAAGADESGEIGECHEPETHLIPLALRAAAGQNAELVIHGDNYATPDGTCVRDYVHVTDIAEAHVLGLEYLAAGGASEFLNLGSGRGHSVREVVAAVEAVTGQRLTQRIGPRRAGDPPVLVADSTKAMQILGWQPKRSLEQMVSSAWAWTRRRAQQSAKRSSPAC
jgi:UDP-glucose-4-epimerase GalE